MNFIGDCSVSVTKKDLSSYSPILPFVTTDQTDMKKIGQPNDFFNIPKCASNCNVKGLGVDHSTYLEIRANNELFARQDQKTEQILPNIKVEC